MKYGVFILIVGVVSVTAAMPVEAANKDLYLELDVGQADYSKAVSFFAPTSPGSTSTTKYEDRQPGIRLLLTYKFDRYWGIEGGYVKFNQASAELTCVSNCGGSGAATSAGYQVDALGAQVDVIAYYPFSDDWSLFGRAGVITETVDFSESNNSGLLFSSISESDTSLDGLFGIGISRKVAENCEVRLGWDRYLALGNADRNPNRHFDISFISIGVQYHFR